MLFLDFLYSAFTLELIQHPELRVRTKMSQFTRLIRFESAGNVLFADLTSTSSEIPSLGSRITAYRTFESFINNEEQVEAVVDKV